VVQPPRPIGIGSAQPGGTDEDEGNLAGAQRLVQELGEAGSHWNVGGVAKDLLPTEAGSHRLIDAARQCLGIRAPIGDEDASLGTCHSEYVPPLEKQWRLPLCCG